MATAVNNGLKQTELAFSVFYDLSMMLGKISILLLLVRVFTLHQRWFRLSVYFWAAWTMLWWIGGLLVIFLECRPLSTNWGVPTQCRPSFTTSVTVGVFNAVSDVGILMLPQPLIWKLHLPFNKKLWLSVLFMVGSLYVPNPGQATDALKVSNRSQCHRYKYCAHSIAQGRKCRHEFFRLNV